MKSDIGFQQLIGILLPGIILSISLFMYFDLSVSSKNLSSIIVSKVSYITLFGIFLFFAGVLFGMLNDALHHLIEFIFFLIIRLKTDAVKSKLSLKKIVNTIFKMERGKGQVLSSQMESPTYNLNIIGTDNLKYMEEEFYYSDFFLNTIIPLIILGTVLPDFLNHYIFTENEHNIFFIKHLGFIIYCLGFLSLLAGIGTLLSYRQNIAQLIKGSLANSSEIFTCKEASIFLKLDEHIIFELVHAKKIPNKEILGQIRFLRSDLINWMSDNKSQCDISDSNPERN